jgi:hypothetical protein
MTDTFSEYNKRTKRNILTARYKKLSESQLLSLTKYQTTVCVLARPPCKECLFREDDEYCPRLAAQAELRRRHIQW